MEIKTDLNSFKLLEKTYNKEINSEILIFEHIKTKAKIIKILNQDKDNSFGISFFTPTKNSKGIPHIIEHSVLVSSKKYKKKDIFFELYGSTINSFINAFTYPDKTTYLFSSPNKKEFFKILDVYLDAVFNPLFIKEKNIFLQEGWRYTINKKEIEITGVVLNEMIGNRSSPLSVIEIPTLKSLYNKSCYSYDYGGDPLEIINLNYEEFLEFYKNSYHPSNSLIYFYGNNNFIEELKFIEPYLKNYNYTENNYKNKSKKSKLDYNFNPNYTININNKKIKINQIKQNYYINNKKDINNYYLSYSYNLIKNTKYKEILKLKILFNILFEENNSPLKKEIINSKLSNNFKWHFETDILYSHLTIIFQNTKKENKEKLIELIETTLNNLIKNKIDKNLIEGVLNRFEYSLKKDIIEKTGYSKGIYYLIKILKTWFYNQEHITYLEPLKTFKEIIKEYQNNNNYFEDLIKKYLLNCENRGLVILEPKISSLKEELTKKIKEKLTEEKIKKIKNEINQFKEFQKKKDNFELELLNTNEIPKEPIYFINPKKTKIDILNKKINLIEHTSKNISFNHIELYFKTNIELEKLRYLKLLIYLLEETKSKHYSYNEFSNLIINNLFKLDYDIIIIKNPNQEETKINIYLKISFDFKKEKIKNIQKITYELFNNAIFTEEKFKEILKRKKEDYYIDIIEEGNYYSYLINSSNHSIKGHIEELLNGISFYKFIKNIELNNSTKNKKILTKIKEIYQKTFSINNLELISYLYNNEEKIELKFLERTIKNKEKLNQINNYNINLTPKNIGILANSSVLFNSIGLNLLKKKYSGKYLLLKNFILNNYLFEKIRFLGGAYGVNGIYNNNGDFYFTSYRDPNLKKTYETYKNSLDYINSINNFKEIHKSIINTFSTLDKPIGEITKLEQQVYLHLSGLNKNHIIKIREEILNTTLNNFKETSKKLSTEFKKSSFCSLGNKELILKNKNLFDEIIEL